jgi:hypothetical protein
MDDTKIPQKNVTENFKEGDLWEDNDKDGKTSGGNPHFY